MTVKRCRPNYNCQSADTSMTYSSNFLRERSTV